MFEVLLRGLFHPGRQLGHDAQQAYTALLSLAASAKDDRCAPALPVLSSCRRWLARARLCAYQRPSLGRLQKSAHAALPTRTLLHAAL